MDCVSHTHTHARQKVTSFAQLMVSVCVTNLGEDDDEWW